MSLTKRTRKAIVGLVGHFRHNRAALKKLLSDWDSYFEREGIDRHKQAPKFFNIMGERARAGIVSLSPPVPTLHKEQMKAKTIQNSLKRYVQFTAKMNYKTGAHHGARKGRGKRREV